mmetsp:Transcript_7294/g.21166  ORF Transcript_7294/g.21166 Transcript_7294/m.21166 type:complete len:334 (-) Transcript_7294:415-1416(-)
MLVSENGLVHLPRVVQRIALPAPGLWPIRGQPNRIDRIRKRLLVHAPPCVSRTPVAEYLAVPRVLLRGLCVTFDSSCEVSTSHVVVAHLLRISPGLGRGRRQALSCRCQALSVLFVVGLKLQTHLVFTCCFVKLLQLVVSKSLPRPAFRPFWRNFYSSGSVVERLVVHPLGKVSSRPVRPQSRVVWLVSYAPRVRQNRFVVIPQIKAVVPGLFLVHRTVHGMVLALVPANAAVRDGHVVVRVKPLTVLLRLDRVLASLLHVLPALTAGHRAPAPHHPEKISARLLVLQMLRSRSPGRPKVLCAQATRPVSLHCETRRPTSRSETRPSRTRRRR